MSIGIPARTRRAGLPVRRIGRLLLLAAFAMGLLVVTVLLVASLIYPPTYVFRLLRWGVADVGDYQRFPGRQLEASQTPFSFRQGLDEARIQGLFEEAGQADLDAVLAETGTQAFLAI